MEGKRTKDRPGIIKLIIGFLWTGSGYEDKQRLYLILGITTISLAVIFGAILLVSAFITVLRNG